MTCAGCSRSTAGGHPPPRRGRSLIARRARRADVVYATSMTRRAALGAALARRPLVLKLTADEAYERERRSGRFAGDLDAFQRHRGGLARAACCVPRATRPCVAQSTSSRPSGYLRDLVLRWGIPAERVSVSPNPAPEVPQLPPRDELRRELGMDGPTLGFAGRLMAAKALDVALRGARSGCPASRSSIVGDGPDRARARAAERRARARRPRRASSGAARATTC